MDMQKRVLQIAHDYEGPFPEVCSQYNKFFSEQGFHITTLYLKGKECSRVEERTEGHEVIFLDQSDKQLRGLKIGTLLGLKRLIKENNYHILLGHRYKAIYLISLLGWIYPELKLIGIAHEFHVFARYSRKFLIKRMSHKLLMLGVSDSVKADLKHSCPSLINGHLQTLHNSIDVESLRQNQYSREEARKLLDLPEGEFVIATVGRLNKKKDHATLIQAFASVSATNENARLVIVGVGSKDKELKQQANQLGLDKKVSFLGKVPNAAIYFKAFDLFVLPSRREPFGMVILEAMAAEVFVICSNYGGPSEVVDKTGMIFQSGDASDLSRCINTVINLSAEERIQYTSAALDRVFNYFSPQAFEKNLYNISEKYLEESER